MRDSPLSSIDEQIIGATADAPSDLRLLRYLDSLLQILAARGGYGLSASLRYVNENVRTEGGKKIDRFEVAFDEEQARAFGTDRFVLRSEPSLVKLTEALVAVREIIEQELPTHDDLL